MKKTLSILFASLILVSGMHLTIATHFCDGVVAASKVSFTGELATCGMENSENTKPIEGKNLINHCCDNELLTYSVDNNFAPSNSISIDTFKSLTEYLFLPAFLFSHSTTPLKSISSNVLPPGKLMANSVRLIEICVFRI